MRILSRPLQLHLAVYGLYLIVAVVITWPLMTVFSTRLIGHPFGDSYEYIALIWWFKHALQTDAPLFFQPLFAYPNGLPGNLLWSIPLQSFPSWLFAFMLPLPAAFNLSFLLTLALNGWSAFFLVSYLTGNRAAAWVAGVVFMAYPTFQGQLAAGHIGLLELCGVPLYIYALFQLRQTQERRWIIWGAVFFVVSLLGGGINLIYVLFPVTIVFVARLLLRREWVSLRRVLLTALVGGLLSSIFLMPVIVDNLSTPALLREGGEVSFSADLLAVISPSFQHPLFSGLDYPHRVLGIDPFEKIAYIGIAAGLLGLVAIWRKPEARWWLLLGLLAWIFSLGPVLKIFDVPIHRSIEGYETLVTLPWIAAQNIPLLNISRTPARFDFTLALAVSVLAGYGMSIVLDSIVAKRIVGTRYNVYLRWLIVIIASAVSLYEYPFFWRNGLPDMPTIPGIVPAAIAALANRTDVRAVLDIPWDHLLTDKEAMFLQTGHQHPIVAGHITRRTPVDPAKLTLLQQTLDPALLKAAGADIIILHKQWDDAEGKTEAFTRGKLGEPIYEDENYALFNAPKTDPPPGFTVILSTEQVVNDHADSYLYTPSPGWTLLTATLQADGRDLTLSLNGTQIHTWHVDGKQNIVTPVFLRESGYYTLSLSLDPPCLVISDPVFVCRSVQVSQLALADLIPAEPANPVDFAGGLALEASRIIVEAKTLTVWLDWRFDAARSENDVRFVHVIDSQGKLVAQSDHALGAQPAGSQWSEAVKLDLPSDLPPGQYLVYTGWYTYPDTRPFPIVSTVPNADSGSLDIGTFSVQ